MQSLKRSYRGRKVLVTGNTGFKGSWLSLWLKKLGATVIGFSLDPPTIPNLFDTIHLREQIVQYYGDIRDGKKVISVVKKEEPDFIFHLAAQPLVRFSYKDPRYTYETNVMGTVNILEAIRRSDFHGPCIIVTTDKCYENVEKEYKYREDDRLGGYDPYSSSKACAELVVNAYRQSFFNPGDFGKSHHVSLSTVRAGNIIGGGDWGEDRLIPDCIRALANDKKITIRNPQAIRPWQYILDPLYGYLLLGKKMAEHGEKYTGAWNFGPGNTENIPVGELVKRVIDAWGSGKYSCKESKNFHEAQLLSLDTSKAKTILGWTPQYTLDDAIPHTIHWYKSYYHEEHPDLEKICIDEILTYEHG